MIRALSSNTGYLQSALSSSLLLGPFVWYFCVQKQRSVSWESFIVPKWQAKVSLVWVSVQWLSLWILVLFSMYLFVEIVVWMPFSISSVSCFKPILFAKWFKVLTGCDCPRLVSALWSSVQDADQWIFSHAEEEVGGISFCLKDRYVLGIVTISMQIWKE